MVRLTRSTMVTSAAAALLLAGLVAGVAAQGPAGRRGPGPKRMGGSGGPSGLPLGQLELSEAQRSQVRDVTQTYAEQLKKASEQLRAAQEAQRNAVETYPLNESLVRSTAQALSTALTEMAVVQAHLHHDIYSILTPDQQTKARELDEKREARMKERQQQMQKRRQLR